MQQDFDLIIWSQLVWLRSAMIAIDSDYQSCSDNPRLPYSTRFLSGMEQNLLCSYHAQEHSQ
jgi:hypothetical protein